MLRYLIYSGGIWLLNSKEIAFKNFKIIYQAHYIFSNEIKEFTFFVDYLRVFYL